MPQILRTNYRKTGGIVGVLAFGGHLLSTCMFGDSQGFRIDQYPNGGFWYISVSGSLGDDAVGTAAYRRAWCDSTYGLMSRWNGNPASGYVWYPMGIDVFSFSDQGLISADVSGVNMGELIHVSNEGSIVMASIVWRTVQGAEPFCSISLRGTCQFRAHMWGFVVSAP